MSRRSTALAAASTAALLLAACGGQNDGGDRPDDGGNSASEVRDIEHTLGTAEDVPVAPKRVVALDPYFSLPTAALGDVEIVGASGLLFGDTYPGYVDADRVAGTTDVGWFTELDITGIHALKPDLIIGVESFVEPSYDQLQKIAPTVALPLDHATWNTVNLAADAMGISDEVDAATREYTERAEELAGRLTETEFPEEPVTVLQFRSVEDIRIYTDHCSTRVLKDLGLSLHQAEQTPEGETALQVGAEQLTQADSSFVFYLIGAAGSNPEDAQDAFDTVSQQPLWDRLEAVERGDTAEVSSGHWFNCGSVQANNLILDDVQKILLDE